MEETKLRAFERSAERGEQRLCPEHVGRGVIVSETGVGAFFSRIIFPRPEIASHVLYVMYLCIVAGG